MVVLVSLIILFCLIIIPLLTMISSTFTLAQGELRRVQGHVGDFTLYYWKYILASTMSGAVLWGPLKNSFICGFFLALMNGIPLKMSGITNDAYNLILMHRDLNTRKYLALQLAVNAEVQKGVRLKDMPDEWFPNDEVTDYRNIMQVAVKLLYISRYVDRKEFETAHVLFSEIERHKEEIVGLYVKEIECELLFLELIGKRRKEEVERLYTDKIKRYIQRYKIMMSSKQRLLCALALYWENQPERAKEIYEKVARKRDKYLLQGEVNSDLDIMETMLREAQVQV